MSEETPKSPLALPAGGGGGTRWRRPGGREFSSWIPAGGGGETGPAEAAAATGGGGGLIPRLPSADNTSASEQVPEPALAKMAAEKERK